MSDSNLVAFRYILESTPGVTPASPQFESVCHQGAGLAANPQTVQSQLICANGRDDVEDLSLVGLDGNGTLPIELVFAEYDIFYQMVLRSSWNLRNRRVNVASTDRIDRPASNQITAVSGSAYTVISGTTFEQGTLVHASGFNVAGNNGLKVVGALPSGTSIPASGLATESTPPNAAEIHDVGVQGTAGDIETTTTGGNALISTTLDFTTLGIAVGDPIKIGGSTVATQFATGALNDWVIVSAVSANRIDLEEVPAGWATDAGATKTIHLYFGDHIVNGVTNSTITAEREFSDTALYQYARGVYPSTHTIQATQRQHVTGGFNFENLTPVPLTDTREPGATTLDIHGYKSMTSVNLKLIREGGVTLEAPGEAFDLSMNFQRNPRRRNGFGVTGSTSMGYGDYTQTGGLTLYLHNPTISAKATSNTESSLNSFFVDSGGRAYAYLKPRIKYSSGDPSQQGRNSDIDVPLQYQALWDAAKGYSFKLARCWHMPTG